MNTKSSAVILFLCFLTLLSLTGSITCPINITEGDFHKFKLTDDNSLQDSDRFSIQKDNKQIVVPRRNRDQKGPGIVEGNFLKLQINNIKDSGTYKVEVVTSDGTRKTSFSESICVYAKVPKPKVNITCLEKNIDIRCESNVDKDQRWHKWHRNGNELQRAMSFTATLEDTAKYTCTVHNPVDKNTSDPVQADCGRKLFGFDFWIMVGILAGGGGLVLILIIVMVICSCRACKRKEKQQYDEDELRLNYHNIPQGTGQQKSKQTARGQPAPPEPYDDVSAQDIPSQGQNKARNQTRSRPPPPPIDDDEEQPPPLPQPRKNVQVKRHE